MPRSSIKRAPYARPRKDGVSPVDGRQLRTRTSPVRSGVQRPPMERMVQLHGLLSQGKYPNCQRLALELGVSSKTIQRDIDFMRDRLKLPIEYNQQNFGFFYKKSVKQFPTLKVTEKELVALFIAKRALEQYEGSPFEKSLRSAFQKLCEGLVGEVDFNWNGFSEEISFKGIPQTKAEIDTFEEVSRALLKGLELDFDYKKLKSSKFEPRSVRPVHLGYIEGSWYLFAFDLSRKQERTFALNRMAKAICTERKFNKKGDFSITEKLKDSFGVFTTTKTGKEKYSVKIEFSGMAARLVAERSWHPSQVIKETGDESITLHLELGSLEEIQRWILSWGPAAKVLGPKELVTLVRDAAKSTAERYA